MVCTWIGRRFILANPLQKTFNEAGMDRNRFNSSILDDVWPFSYFDWTTFVRMRTYSGNITSLKENEVFVFGSNLDGFHVEFYEFASSRPHETIKEKHA